MNIKALITTLVIGSSSVAMAGPSFQTQAQAHVSWSFNTAPTAPTIRDHRVATTTTPVRVDRRFVQQDARFGYNARYTTEQPTLTVPVTEDCSNWDPTLGTSNCGREVSFNTRIENPWTSLGSRDSSMSDHQYITVEQQYRQLRIESLSGSPTLSKVAIRYIDGSVQVVEPGTVRGCNEAAFARGGNVINLEQKEISQVVMYTAPGARGVYSVYAI